jgi:hypothetical protein
MPQKIVRVFALIALVVPLWAGGKNPIGSRGRTRNTPTPNT